jgi:hypothetical protein
MRCLLGKTRRKRTARMSIVFDGACVGFPVLWERREGVEAIEGGWARVLRLETLF